MVRTISSEALEMYTDTDVVLVNKFGRRHGILIDADDLPPNTSIVNDIRAHVADDFPADDFYIHFPDFYVPLKEGNGLKVRLNSSVPHVCCVREYVYLGDKD